MTMVVRREIREEAKGDDQAAVTAWLERRQGETIRDGTYLDSSGPNVAIVYESDDALVVHGMKFERLGAKQTERIEFSAEVSYGDNG